MKMMLQVHAPHANCGDTATSFMILVLVIKQLI
jgi:hypothetical protein